NSGVIMNQRVVVTGMGVISSIGENLEQLWDALIAGKSGIRKIESMDVSQYSTQIAAEASQFDPLNYMEKKDARKMDRFVQFAVAASALAIQDAQLNIQEDTDPERVGVYVGSGIGGLQTW